MLLLEAAIRRESGNVLLLRDADQVSKQKRSDAPALPVLMGCESDFGITRIRIIDIPPDRNNLFPAFRLRFADHRGNYAILLL